MGYDMVVEKRRELFVYFQFFWRVGSLENDYFDNLDSELLNKYKKILKMIFLLKCSLSIDW
jgi:hypothetical protein